MSAEFDARLEFAHFRRPPVVAGDPDYEAARRVWNGYHDPFPAAILRCSSAEEIGAVIRSARERDLPLAVRGGGHSFPGYGSCDGGLVIDLAPLDEVVVDAERRVASVGGGATWGQVDRATAAQGLAIPGGLVSTTGVGGLTLGGGIGWLSRAWGLACDQLVAADVVLADGTRVRATESENSDLLWALRGGGGNFGVVARFEFRLHPLPPASEVLGGMVFYPAEAAVGVLGELARFAAEMPDELSTLAAFVSVPPLPFLPTDLHFRPAIAIALCDLGAAAEAERRTAPLRRLATPLADLVGRLPYVELQRQFDAGAPAGLRQYGCGLNLSELSAAAITVLTEQSSSRPTPLCQIHLHQLGGAAGRIAEDATAYGGRDARWVVNLLGTWTDPADDARVRDWVSDSRQRLSELASARAYVNFLPEPSLADVRRAYGSAHHDRLRELKRRFDPTNLFRRNANIQPAD